MKQHPKPAGLGALDYHLRVPSSKDGAAQLADLNQTGSTETRRTNAGHPAT